MSCAASSGIFLVDKAAGPSSAQVLSQIKKKLKPDKIGHAGTLDPFATGLLVVLVGRATRLATYAEGGRKRYRAIAQLGCSTDTEDYTGTVLQSHSVAVSAGDITLVGKKFTGSIEQVPSRFSALKVNGVRAYELARRGEDVALAARQVQIYELHCQLEEDNRLAIDVCCSSGTYVRALARDIGEALGCGACLLSLRRLASKPFVVENAKEVPALSWSDLLSWTTLFEGPRLSLDMEQCLKLAGGNQACLRHLAEAEAELALRVYEDSSGTPRGLLRFISGKWELAWSAF